MTTRPDEAPSPLIMDRYRDRPDVVAEIEANWEAWERLQATAHQPAAYEEPSE